MMTKRKSTSKVSAFLMTFILLASLSTATLSTVVSAHELQETRARITLRDGQVEIKLSTDINRWQTLLQDNKAWLMGDIEQVMPAGLNTKQNKAFLKNELKQNTNISINNKKLAFDVVSVSTIENQPQGHYAEIVLSGRHTNKVIDQLNIKFPKSLGAVHASFVQPQYKMMAPGSRAEVSFAAPVAAPIAKMIVADHHH